MLLTKKEIFERLKKEGIDLGNNPFRTFLYYQETGLIPEPEGKKKNAFLFPEETVDSVKLVYDLQKNGESITQIKKRYKDFMVENTERIIQKRDKNINLINGKLKLKDGPFLVDAIKYLEEKKMLPNIEGINIKEILIKYGLFVAGTAIMKLILAGDFLESKDIESNLLEKK